GLLRLGLVPEVPLEVRDLGVGDEVRGDVFGPELGRGTEERVHRPLGVGGRSTAGGLQKRTPAARMSWPNTAPIWSFATRPMNAAEPPNDAMPTMVFAAEPPAASVAGTNGG